MPQMLSSRLKQLLFLLVLLPSSFLTAQTAANNPLVDSFGTDSINLVTLTPTVNVPLRSKGGPIATHLTESLSSYCYQGSVLSIYFMYCGTTTVDSDALFGAALVGTAGQPATCPNGTTKTTMVTNLAIVVASGQQKYSLPVNLTDEVDTAGCIPTSWTDHTIDGSGLTAHVSVSSGTITTVVTTPDGLTTTLSGVVTSTSPWYNPNLWGAQTISDPFGNNLSFTGSTLTDSLSSHPVFDFSANSWTDTLGHTQSLSIGAQTVANGNTTIGNNCARPSNFGQQPPASYTYPDGTSIAVTLELDPSGSGKSTGRIGSFTTRSGGTISYAYGTLDCSGLPTTLSRTTIDGTTTYTRISGPATTVVDPGLNKTVYTYSSGSTFPSATVFTQVQKYQNIGTVASPSYSLLTTDVYCYNGNQSNCSTATVTYPISERDVYHTIGAMTTSSRTKTTYDNYGNVTSVSRYDFGGSSPTATTTTYYGTWTGSLPCSAVGSGIVSLPCDIVETDGAGHTIAEKRLTYNGSGFLTSSSIWTGTTWLTVTYTPNSNGTIASSTDPNGLLRTFGYAATAAGGCNGLLETSRSLHVATNDILTEAKTWDCEGPLVLSTTDVNNNPTARSYDALFRQSSFTDPLLLQTTTTYTATSVTTSNSFASSVSNVTTTRDAIGRQIRTQKQQAPSSTNYDTVSNSYGFNGTQWQVGTSVPCVQTVGTPCANNFAQSTVDLLGRAIQSVDTNGSGATSYVYSKNDVLMTIGPAPAGEHTQSKQTEYDGLGRVKSLCQILVTGGSSCGQATAASGYLTSYTYNTFAGGTSTTLTRGSQTRTFTYDAIGRMVSESQPEIGVITYAYDSATGTTCNSNSPGDLIKRTNPDGSWICYNYDFMHRVTDVGISSGGIGGCRRLRYDNTTGVLGSVPSGVTVSNGLGRLVEAETDSCAYPITQSSQTSDEWFSYDADGRLTDVFESTPHSGGYYHTTAAYWPNGALHSLSGVPGYPSMTYGVDGEGRLSSAMSGTTKVVCDTTCSPLSTTYSAANLPLIINIGGTGANGSGDNDTYSYDTSGRMQNYSFTVGAARLSISGALTWNPNGSLRQLAITDGFNAGGTQTCVFGTATTMGYDDLGRLVNVSCNSGSIWQQTFSYDQYDNVTKTGSISWACTSCYDATTNHYNATLSSLISYDTNGNLLNDTFHQYTWDLYGKPIKILPATGTGNCGASGITCVTYDAQGRAVEKQVGSVYTQILYSPIGKTAAMAGQTASGAYFPLPGGATYRQTGSTGGNHYFWHKDWLGTVRLATTLGNRSSNFDRAFAPYGEVYADFGSTSDVDFTGDTQDIVVGTFDTDNRELNATEGRWISPDSARAGWNLYAYSTNPNSAIDPRGLQDFSYSLGSLHVCGGFQGSCLNGSQGQAGSDNWITIKYVQDMYAYLESRKDPLARIMDDLNKVALAPFRPVLQATPWTAYNVAYAALSTQNFSRQVGDAAVTEWKLGTDTIYDTFFRGPVQLFQDAYNGICGADGVACATAPGGAIPVAVEEEAAPIAIGLKDTLDDFAAGKGATTWKSFKDVVDWRPEMLKAFLDPKRPIFVNLDGPVQVWQGIQRSAAGVGGGMDWELYQIYQRPQIWDKITWFSNGAVTENPFK